MSKMPNISDSDLDKIAARQNFKGEDEFETLEAAKLAAKARSMTSNRAIYVDENEKGTFVVHAHGIQKVGWTPKFIYRRSGEYVMEIPK